VAENIIWLQGVIYRERFYRLLSVLKMRFSPHDLTLREFTIAAPDGIAVREPSESAPGLLAGIEREQGDFRPAAATGGPAQGLHVRVRPPLAHNAPKDEV
jgi:circadian clock protein KaiC